MSDKPISEEFYICYSCFSKKYVNDLHEIGVMGGMFAGKDCFSCGKKGYAYLVEVGYLRVSSKKRSQLRGKRIASARVFLKLLYSTFKDSDQIPMDGNEVCFVDELITSLRLYRETLVKKVKKNDR